MINSYFPLTFVCMINKTAQVIGNWPHRKNIWIKTQFWLLLGVEDTVDVKQKKTKEQKNEENTKNNRVLLDSALLSRVLCPGARILTGRATDWKCMKEKWENLLIERQLYPADTKLELQKTFIKCPSRVVEHFSTTLLHTTDWIEQFFLRKFKKSVFSR